MGLWNIFITGSDVTSVTGAEKACPLHCTTLLQAMTIIFTHEADICHTDTSPLTQVKLCNFRCTSFKK